MDYRAPIFVSLTLVAFTLAAPGRADAQSESEATVIADAKARPVTDRLVAQTTIGLATAAAVPVAVASVTGVLAGTVILLDVPVTTALSGAVTLSTAALCLPGILVDHVGAHAGGHRNTLAAIAGSIAGYGVAAGVTAAYWSTPAGERFSPVWMVGSFLLPGLTAVFGYQLAEWLK